MEHPPIIGITHPLILKDGEFFFVCDHRARIVPDAALGLGLFHRDCRFLCRYELRLQDEEPLVLMHSAAEGFIARFEMTNPPIERARSRIAGHALAIARRQALHADWSLLHDRVTVRNCTLETLRLDLRLLLEARFEDIFALRGTEPKRRGELRPPAWEGGVLRFAYLGADRVARCLDFFCTPVPAARLGSTTAELLFPIELPAQGTAALDLFLKVSEVADALAAPAPAQPPSPEEAARKEADTAQRWLRGYSRVESGDARLETVIRRSLADIQLLTIERERRRFIAGGVPWFVALFGRDGLIPSLQCLAYRPELAADTLRVLASRQGRRYAAEQKEEPGKILHELRVGEMAHLGEVPQHPGYGSVDSTILFLIALARHAQWLGTTALFEELEPAVAHALDWMRGDGDGDQDGYLDYDNDTAGAPANQAWKDSADALTYADGTIARGRVALVEVQAYAYLAWTLIAGLYRRVGDGAQADRLVAAAEDLRARFNRDFWMPAQRCYCLALDQQHRQVATVTSNPGHALWAGIAEPDKARLVAERLTETDMFSGWGVRTLSERERRFNPIGYHTGSVWPFDNSLILAGFRRYGHDRCAQKIFAGLFEAAGYFDHHRLPEFFSGVARRGPAGPARCPRADPLQAWSAGALPFMLASLLGLEPDGFSRRLRIVRPALPDGVDRLDLAGVRVGTASVDLRFERCGGAVEWRVRRCDGELDIAE